MKHNQQRQGRDKNENVFILMPFKKSGQYDLPVLRFYVKVMIDIAKKLSNKHVDFKWKGIRYMGMDVEIQLEDGFLNVRVSGRFSLAEANDGLIKMLKAVARHGATRVLVDCRTLQGSITTMQNFDHATFGAKMIDKFSERGVSRATRFAYVTLGAFSDPNKFAETVAVNRGLDVRTFGNIDDALQWLEIDSATVEILSRQINN